MRQDMLIVFGEQSSISDIKCRLRDDKDLNLF